MLSEIIDIDLYRKSINLPDSPNGYGHTTVQCNNCSDGYPVSATGWKRPGKHPKDYLFPLFAGITNSDYCKRD